MGKIIGIIPARGKAVRFGGQLKELLPISNNECGLSRCIENMMRGGADEIILQSTSEKESFHRVVTQNYALVQIACAPNGRGLWHEIREITHYPASQYLFAMPDTIMPYTVFENIKDLDVSIGIFHTDNSERFGMLRDRKIVDKQPGEPGYAYGAFVWSALAAEYLVEACNKYKDHTKALNALLSRFDVNMFVIDYYCDFASFSDYKRYICDH